MTYRDGIDNVKSGDKNFAEFRSRMKNTDIDGTSFDVLKAEFDAFIMSKNQTFDQLYVDLENENKRMNEHIYGKGAPGLPGYVRGLKSQLMSGAADTLIQHCENTTKLTEALLANQEIVLDVQTEALAKLFQVAEEGIKKGWGVQFSTQMYTNIQLRIDEVDNAVKKVSDLVKKMKPPAPQQKLTPDAPDASKFSVDIVKPTEKPKGKGKKA